MPEIALPAFHVTTTTPITVKVGYEMAQDLERYKAFYKQAYGADVAEADLLREMARRFMESDREFQTFKGGAKPRSRGRRTAVNAPAARPDSQAA
jgi:hypothetical protein